MAKLLKIKRKKVLNESGKNYREGLPDTLNQLKDTDENLYASAVATATGLSIKEFEEQVRERNRKNNQAIKDKRNSINISRIDKIDVMKSDGTKDTIYPARIAASARAAMADMYRDPDTSVLAKYFPKDIIWTFDPRINTAATDGVRIFMNPVFGDELLAKSAALYGPKAKEMGDTSNSYLFTLFQYVIIHEVYHQIFQHLRREQLKPETANFKNHELANIAEDVEINRCIEAQLLKYTGCTKALGGMWDERFKVETWEVIFDAYYQHQAEPPQMPHQGQGGGNPQEKGGQNQQNGQDGSGQNSQNNSGEQSNGNSSQNQNQSGQGQGQNQSGQGNGNNQPKSESYKEGWRQAMEDIKNGKVIIQS